MLRGFVFTRSLLGKVLELGWQGYRSGIDALRLFRLVGETASLKQLRARPDVSAGLSAQFAVLCCGVLKGAAGGHDDVCFAFGRNPACR